MTNHLEVLIEPFFWERVIPKGGEVIAGRGDTEVTVSLLVFEEHGARPALVFAAKEKFPTIDNPEIGTGKRDYTGYLILGKMIGPFDFNLNLAGERFGSPEGEHLKDQFVYAISSQLDLGKSLSLYAEYFGNSSPADGLDPVAARSFAFEVQFSKHANIFVSIGRDSEDMENVRSGLNIVW